MARPGRALIIACQRYPAAEDVATELVGTRDAATGFYRWLVDNKLADAANIHLCCDDALIPDHPANRTYTGDRSAILRAIEDLAGGGRDDTGTLFVFFSGHGVGWQVSPQQRGLDVLLASDYRRRQSSGSACIKVDQLRSELRNWLGGEDHYYFLDACRTVMQVGEIQPVDLGLTLPLANNDDPTTYVLYATKFGEPAKINSGFSAALVEGLKGNGRAKQRVAGSWWVRFERVQKFVQERVKGQTDLSKEGPHDGLILPLAGNQTSPCTVTVDDATAADRHTLTIEASGIQQPFTFTGATFQRDLTPNDDGYQFAVMTNGSPLERLDPPAGQVLDLFDPTSLRFGHALQREAFRVEEEVLGVRGAVMEAGPAGLEFSPVTDDNLALQVRKAVTGEAVGRPIVSGRHIRPGFPWSPGLAETWVPLAAGQYVVEVVQDGRVSRREEITLAPGERHVVPLFRQSDSLVQGAIAARLPTTVSGLPDASESLGGPLLDQDTSVWLTILGASRLIRKPADFHKLGPFPLATFDDLMQGDSVVYALAGLDAEGTAPISISISDDQATHWQPMQRVSGIDGLMELRSKQAPGPKLISIAVPNLPPITYATYALPNRAAFLVFHLKASGQLVTRQMLLPVYSLADFEDVTVRERFDKERLGLVRYLTLAQESFASRRSLEPGSPGEQARWQEMLYGKWIDPLFALMAIFEAARRGRTQEALANMTQAIDNLMRYFGDLPDVAVARRVLGLPPLLPPSGLPPRGTPLLLESLQRAPELKATLPLKPDFLEYDSMWTAWFGAVSAPE